MSNIKAIQTEYNGRLFRSRLEARWAVIFDYLGIKYEYEEQGYDVGYGIRYLPDFILYGGVYRCPKQLYVEVKGEMNLNDATKMRLFAESKPLYVVGAIPADIHDICNGIDTEFSVPYYNFDTVDGDYFGAVLGACKHGGWGLFGADSNYWCDMDVDKTQMAYSIGRQARFEYGETPRPEVQW